MTSHHTTHQDPARSQAELTALGDADELHIAPRAATATLQLTPSKESQR